MAARGKLLQTVSKSTFWLFLALLIASGLLNVCRGQDNWWDVINYHIYNPWSLLHHRWSKDLFASGIQGYFHPLADVPYYLLGMVWLPDHPRVLAFLAGIPYGVLVFTVYQILRVLLNAVEGAGRIERTMVTVLALVVAVSGVSAWTQAGTTTNEVTVSAVTLIAVYLLVAAIGERKEKIASARLLAIGGLMGLAAGLKLTAAVYAPAMGLVVLGTNQDLKSALRSGVLFSAGWFVVFAAVYGPWAWHLYSLTGNPMFPMFNNLFHSSFSAAVGGRDTISLPKSIWEWLFYPFFWLDPSHPTVYNRLSFRDARIMLFYLAAVAYFVDYAIRLVRRKEQLVPRKIRILVAFCALSYVVWLVVFSMLRYAIVIEVVSTLLAISLLWSAAARIRMRHGPMVRVAATAALVALVMGTTVYPHVGRIGYSSRVYTATVPPLKKHALVVLANQPMGLLAPLIQRRNKTAEFVGLPRCFKKGRWCYNGFYKYGLGRQLREKIARHAGPIYVVHYMDKMSVMPQLALFRLVVNADDCRRMTTNATVAAAVCSARYIPRGQPMPPLRNLKQKLTVRMKLMMPGVRIKSEWKVNKCGMEVNPAKLTFDWQVPNDVGPVRIYIVAPHSKKRIRFSGGASKGTATTGLWVHSAQLFEFTTVSGKTIATARTEYTSCTPEHGGKSGR